MKDVANAQDESLQNQGIWYCPDEHNMTQGWAMILGPPDTPYDGCLLMFRFVFPADYPFSPPKVTFVTSDGKTRFHPNLYVEGKVCLSILGTYNGPSWSGTQSLTSVLLSIIGLLDNNPLSHEPAYEKGTLADAYHRDYADAVEFNMVKLMTEMLERFKQEPDTQQNLWYPFREIVQQKRSDLEQRLAAKITERAKCAERLWHHLPYSMHVSSQWKRLAASLPFVRGTA